MEIILAYNLQQIADLVASAVASGRLAKRKETEPCALIHVHDEALMRYKSYSAENNVALTRGGSRLIR